jgi:hypothetical protein
VSCCLPGRDHRKPTLSTAPSVRPRPSAALPVVIDQ